METQAVTVTTSGVKQDELKFNQSIGSLGLLNQYASSSDEDEDSSDDDSQNADSECESDSSIEEIEECPKLTSATNATELNTLANNILSSVMSRSNYRVASSDS